VIAISYRREDSTPITGRIYDRLQTEFGKSNVFMDFDSIPYGIDFREHIKKTLEKAKVVVVMIGPDWFGHRTRKGRRIDDPNDFVRLEVAGALEHGIPVIPVLINNARMPKPEMLPTDISQLAFRNGLVLDAGIDFHHHADRLVSGIRAVLPAPLSRKKGPAGEKSSGFSPRKKFLLMAGAVFVTILLTLGIWLLFFNVSKKIRSQPEAASSSSTAPTSRTTQPVTNFPGTVTVKTDPAGATVTLGNQTQKSPATFTGITGNKASIKVTLSGYEAVQQDVAVSDTRPTEIGPIALERARAFLPINGDKLFAGTWRGTVHNVITTKGTTTKSWDAQVELPIDETETRWGNMTQGAVFRRDRTLAYTGVYTDDDGTKQQLHATLMVREDGRTATYTTSVKPLSGARREQVFGKGTLEKLP
jgi:cytoskeletal protein RodZ